MRSRYCICNTRGRLRRASSSISPRARRGRCRAISVSSILLKSSAAAAVARAAIRRFQVLPAAAAALIQKSAIFLLPLAHRSPIKWVRLEPEERQAAAQAARERTHIFVIPLPIARQSAGRRYKWVQREARERRSALQEQAARREAVSERQSIPAAPAARMAVVLAQVVEALVDRKVTAAPAALVLAEAAARAVA